MAATRVESGQENAPGWADSFCLPRVAAKDAAASWNDVNGGRVRTDAIVGAALAIILAAHAGTLRSDPGQPTESERIVRLIEQLGDDSFASREAASSELTAIGEPALSLLRRASTINHDLEIRWRAEQIAQAVVARSLPVGTWNVEFANGVTEVCWIGNDGTASVDEPRRRSGGKAVVQGRSAVVTFDDDRLERWTWEGGRLVVEHWFPSSQFPTATPVVGVAKRTR